MFAQFRPALVLMVLFTVLTGILYPLAITGAAQLAFPGAANGSLLRKGDAVVGSVLIGQNFKEARYFWPRPSVTAEGPYNAASSTGSNLGTTSATLKARVGAEVERLRVSGIRVPVPADAATASGSGLDPDISPAYAKAQIARIATARGMTETDISALLATQTKGRLLGLIGEPRVNVLEANAALDGLEVGR